MIIKSQEINKINLDHNSFILLHGKNDGLKDQIIVNLLKNKKINYKYDEREILINKENFLESISTESLFENEKIIVIKRATDKFLDILTEIINKNYKDILLIINADLLEKKSKLRSFFEKGKELVCVPLYPDNEQTLARIAYTFFKENNVPISSSNINLIVRKCNGDRKILLSEIKKLELYSKSGKKINSEVIIKLTNLIENHSISELIDNCLAHNKKKTINILNENNFNNDECILIARIFLNKLKRILVLSTEFQKNKNIDLTISSARPPIFWKEKEITKKQIIKWKPDKIKKIIYKLVDIELTFKKNINNATNLIIDFILENSSEPTNN